MKKPDPNQPNASLHRGYSFQSLKQRLRTEYQTLLSVTTERKEAVCDSIMAGSTPDMRYYILLSISSLIAGLGLITNSPAVVIGAMLISPLMTPIFGVSLGIYRGDALLLRRALIGIIGGVLLAILVTALLGSLPIPFEVTPEMLMRTQPTLLELGVATLAGLAGCLAMIDERMSPVLPGIAIATAIVPPLATCGLCLALGAYEGAWGAFLLFFANFLAILIVSSALFSATGFMSLREFGTGWSVIRRMSGALIGFVVVAFLLTQALIGIIESERTRNAIQSILQHELADEPATTIFDFLVKEHEAEIDILATIRTPKVLTPGKVETIQQKIADELQTDVKLIIRCDIMRDISATGATSAVVNTNLDGDFLSSDLSPNVKRYQLAEQALREALEGRPAFSLRDFELLTLSQGPLVIATIRSPRKISTDEVAQLEETIQQRLQDRELRILVRSDAPAGVSSKGKVLYGRAHFGNLPAGEVDMQASIEARGREAIGIHKNIYVTAIDAVNRGDRWAVRAEVIGPRVLTPAEVSASEAQLLKATGQKVDLEIWSRTDLIVTRERYFPLDGAPRQQRR